jgi:hypothetical protein
MGEVRLPAVYGEELVKDEDEDQMGYGRKGGDEDEGG